MPQDYTLSINWYTQAAEQGYARAQNNLAWLLATCPQDELRNGQEAVVQAQKACELTEWNSAGYIDTLAAAYAEAGVFDDAVENQLEALKDVNFLETHGDGARARLELYKAGKPYRESPEM